MTSPLTHARCPQCHRKWPVYVGLHARGEAAHVTIICYDVTTDEGCHHQFDVDYIPHRVFGVYLGMKTHIHSRTKQP